jgi:alpha,alpha-trehalase
MRAAAATTAFAATLLLPLIPAIYIDGPVTAPCDSPLYCHGEILKQIQLAGAFDDSKTYVDLPTIRPLEAVLSAFDALAKPLKNDTALNDFLRENFGAAGSELGEVHPEELTTNATFLGRVANRDVRDFLEQVIDIWPQLTRKYVGSAGCEGCVSSFIPLNHTFVVAGGRFRELYYVCLSVQL